MSDETARLRAELAAARRTIEALQARRELEQSLPDVQGFAVAKAMANLESIIEQRTRDLRQSEARYRALYDHSPDMLFTLDASGGMTAANQRSAAMVGRPAEELVGTPFADLFEPASAARVREVVRRGLETAAEHDLQLWDGRDVALMAAAVPGLDDIQVVLRDVTARRRLEAELAHTRRLAAIGHLAAGVAHEINNPLAVIQGRLEIFDVLELDLPDAVRRDLAVVSDHVQRIARIVRNLQSFARRGTLERRPVSVLQAIEAARELAGPQTARTEWQIDVLPSDLHVLGDRGQLDQVLANLFANAGDAMNGGGRITVVARLDGPMACIDVLDEGPGVPPGMAEEIFAPFVTGKPPTKGTGLGLAIVWGIVQEHGGTVSADNRVDGGARFRLRLPVATEPSRDEEIARVPEPVRPLRVLLVEDEESLLATLDALARSAGHTTHLARSAEEALGVLAHDGSFDVMLTDLRLPGMSGAELCGAVSSVAPSLAGRVIVMSGLFQNAEPAYRYLQKPFTRGDLLEALEVAARATPGDEPS